ncbi:unnamed protein product [Lepeophtheirus salmonis]|uniref:(salmon louse) hypothetical protein n=3 Tax=Lepeophtheirus salmonis TaxID=72036 RepID=A0A7R8D9L8_LEPSM|nr:unnamed protein product [Lepeophtheirus salmonis]CAF3019150.1 unnamed protein product [Lepeophtheirus salmonis]
MNGTSTFSPSSILAVILVGILIALAFGPGLLNNTGAAYDRNYYQNNNQGYGQEYDGSAYVKTDRRSLDASIIMKYSLFIGFCLLALSTSYAYADPLDIVEDVDDMDEERTITTNNGNVLLSFNASNVLFYGAIIGIGLLGLVALAVIFSIPAFSEQSGYNNRYSNSQYNQYYDENESLYDYQGRSTRSISDVAQQLYALAEAFKKYEVEESCQKYVACAARRNTESYALMTIVDDVMRSMLKSGHEKIREKDAYVGELLDAYLQGERTSCQQHRNICYRKKFN